MFTFAPYIKGLYFIPRGMEHSDIGLPGEVYALLSDGHVVFLEGYNPDTTSPLSLPTTWGWVLYRSWPYWYRQA